MLDLLLFGRRKLILDGRTDAVFAWAPFRLRTLYAGPLLRVRRSSDSLEADFGAGLGVLDWGPIASFIGAGQGFVARAYDQSGLGHDFVQATAASQPQIALLANGLPGMIFDGVDDNFQVAFTLNQPWTFHLAYRRLATVHGAFENILDGVAADSGTLFHNLAGTGAPTDNAIYAGDFGPQSDNGVSMPVGVRGVVGGVFNGAASILEVNAATLASSTGNTLGGNPGGLTCGSRGDRNPSRFTNFEAQALIAFNTAHPQPVVQQDNRDIRRLGRF